MFLQEVLGVDLTAFEGGVLRVGPTMARLAARNWSTIQPQRRFRTNDGEIDIQSFGDCTVILWRHVQAPGDIARPAMPGLPGDGVNLVREYCGPEAPRKACSRPPPPMTRIFISRFICNATIEVSMQHNYDVVVVGGGHAGCEAARACARMGLRTAMITMNADLIAQMSCNPAIGGIAKGHLVREIDALGGVMGEVADAVGIQFRLLNTSRGPAVWSPRAQCDKKQYRIRMKEVLEREPNLSHQAGGSGGADR